MTFQMNNDEEWILRQRELIGDDDFILSGNLVRFGEDDPDYREVVRQMSLEKEPGHVPPVVVPSVAAPQSGIVAE